MKRHPYFLALLLLLSLSPSPLLRAKRQTFLSVLHHRARAERRFDLLYKQKFTEARDSFADWESRNPQQPLAKLRSRPATSLRSCPAKAC